MSNIRNHYFKPENKTDICDFTIFGIKIGPVPDLQELPERNTKAQLKINSKYICFTLSSWTQSDHFLLDTKVNPMMPMIPKRKT